MGEGSRELAGVVELTVRSERGVFGADIISCSEGGEGIVRDGVMCVDEWKKEDVVSGLNSDCRCQDVGWCNERTSCQFVVADQ